MSDARQRILRRLRQSPAVLETESFADGVRRFDWGPEERLAHLRAALEAVRGEWHEVAEDWPSVLARLLAQGGARTLAFGPDGREGRALAVAWPEGSPQLVPYRDPVETWRETLFDGVDAGFTSCLGAVAETGTLVLRTGPEEPRLLSLVPPTHAILLDAANIRSTFAELLEEQGWSAGLPTNVLLISGPSRSADIEQTLTYGVHGPARLIVLVRGAADTSV